MMESKFLYGHSRSECVGIPARGCPSEQNIMELPRKTPPRKHRQRFVFFLFFFFEVRNVGSPERTPSLMMKHLIRCLKDAAHPRNKCRQSSRLLSSTQRQNKGN